MGKLFENPWVVLIIIIVIVLLFAAPKLPGMARSLGQSMRIIKSEVKEMKSDSKTEGTGATAAAPAEQPVEGKIVNNPPHSGGQVNGDGRTPGTGNPS
ncbi:Sec-independent protein translocase subunit TatA [Paenarthrobacter sp. PH39-S1]|uniref:Sec-independent protein translocase subunit TatA n=1 Tax=Paenarthrobacter sp. PH39-S1 TaxID=3046204 RepID=UPI0024B89192|nr:Sec-independent protein translocase subunit TatA [Paenarthrobacter sp. PH39-S1]MDJ0356778.1 Sec-independent protein translocase subunit TatA [Paenarthrobacter sp. PH39-S1]